MDFALVRFAALVGVNGGDLDSRRHQRPVRMVKTLMPTNVDEFLASFLLRASTFVGINVHGKDRPE